MLLVLRYAITRAHGARIELAAMAVVVAHLDGLREPARQIVAATRQRLLPRQRIAFDVPCGPVERGLDPMRFVARRKAEIACVVHFRWTHDLVGIEAVIRIEQRLDFGEGLIQTRPVLPRDPFAAAQAVAMLAGIRALVFAHQCRRFFGNGAHFDRAVAPHIENRPHVQCADTRMRIPGAFRSVTMEHFGQAARVFRQMFERHRAIFDEGDRLAVALHAHHDVQAGFTDFPQRFLFVRGRHLDDRIGQAQIGHELSKLFERRELLGTVLAREFHQQDRLRLADQRLLDHRPEGGIAHR